MIKVKLKEQMKLNNIRTASELVAKTNNQVHRNTISNLLNGKVKGIQFDTLNHLCKALNCNENDLIEYVEE